MKKSGFKFLYFILIITISNTLSFCDKNEVKPADNCAEKGNCDIMTCKVNGISWKADCTNSDPLFGCDPVVCYYYGNDFYLEIRGVSLNPKVGIFFISKFKNFDFLGYHSLKNQFVLGCPSCNVNNVNANFYGLDSLYLAGKHLEIIQIDTINNWIEGKFDFRAIEYSTHDTAYITDGYFKLSFL